MKKLILFLCFLIIRLDGMHTKVCTTYAQKNLLQLFRLNNSCNFAQQRFTSRWNMFGQSGNAAEKDKEKLKMTEVNELQTRRLEQEVSNLENENRKLRDKIDNVTHKISEIVLKHEIRARMPFDYAALLFAISKLPDDLK